MVAELAVAALLTTITHVPVTCGGTMPAVPAEGQRPSGLYLTNPARIWLVARSCRWIAESLTRPRKPRFGYYEAGWNTFAHEYAHHRGYDHGELTVGADCQAERRYDRVLMRRAGISLGLARAIDRSVNRIECA